MAIQPIDLQTLFTQVDKVGKIQAAQKEGVQIQASLHQLETQRKAEELVRSVNETQGPGEGAESVRNNGRRGQERGEEGGARGEPEKTEEDSEAAKKRSFIRDPSLGHNLDISG